MTTETNFESNTSNDEPNEVPQVIKDGVQATIDELKELNLGIDEEPHPIYMSSLLTPEEESKYLELLMECRDVFAWTCKEMPGLETTIAFHRLAIKQGMHLIK